jgi:hypothetical protein
MELDARQLYVAEGYPSLFAYCTDALHLSEHAAYHRIAAARAARRFPPLLERLRAGELTLTAVGLLAQHLTEANHVSLLDAARHQPKRTVEALVARLDPRPDVPSSVRRLPAPRAVALDRTDPAPTAPPLLASTDPREGPPPVVLPPPRPAVVRALAPARYQLQMTVSAETHAKLRRAQDLLRHAVPNGDPAVIVDRALTLLLAQLEQRKCAATKPRSGRSAAARSRRRPSSGAAGSQGAAPTRASSGPRALEPPHNAPPSDGTRQAERPRSRTIPAAVRRAVWARDGGQCAYVGTAGRCPERGGLEYHHEVPFAAGGAATVANVSLRCRTHNRHEAVVFFGAAVAGTRRTGAGRAVARSSSARELARGASSPELRGIDDPE